MVRPGPPGHPQLRERRQGRGQKDEAQKDKKKKKKEKKGKRAKALKHQATTVTGSEGAAQGQPGKGRLGGTFFRGVDFGSVGAAPARALFTAATNSASPSSARGPTTAEERIIHDRAVAQTRAVDAYDQTRHCGATKDGSAACQRRGIPPDAGPGTTRPAEPSEPPRQRIGQKGGKQPREGLAQKIMKTAIRMDKAN